MAGNLSWLRGFVGRAPSWLLALGLGGLVGAAVMGLRGAGLLQGLELGAYDRFLAALRVPSQPDPRIVLIRITEPDIARYGHPLSDEILARALRGLAAQGPRVIGVDLYRDRPTPPGEAELRSAVLANPGIVLIEKVSGGEAERIRPPAYVIGTGQVGFSDVKADHDNVHRRGLLSMQSAGTSLSLPVRLATRYLAFEGLFPRWVASGDGPEARSELHFGDARIASFRANGAMRCDIDVLILTIARKATLLSLL